MKIEIPVLLDGEQIYAFLCEFSVNAATKEIYSLNINT